MNVFLYFSLGSRETPLQEETHKWSEVKHVSVANGAVTPRKTQKCLMKPVEIHIVENNRDTLPYSNRLEVNEPCQISIKMKSIASYIMVCFVKRRSLFFRWK